ncbi:hypothetical protein RND81_02G191000 [Saponaria officinalis]|uniref:Zinc finger GRF-type domain-containing protein n=1 Tax=Saponaria officinalis TaxID=3572 RepID=A0AAW1MS49_SAPOF
MSYASHTSSYARGVRVENKQCPRCNRRSNIRSSGPTAANPFKLYYKCDNCGWFQWCKAKDEQDNHFNGNEEEYQMHNQHELRKSMKEQLEMTHDLKAKIDDLSKLFQRSIKVAVLMYLFLIYIVMSHRN